MNYVRKTFSISNEEVLEKLEQVENQSQYVQDLILRDIISSETQNQYYTGVIHALLAMLESLDLLRENVYRNITK